MSDPLTTQYKVLAERRLHFGRLYWQSIALLCTGLLAAAIALRDLSGTWLGTALIVAGAASGTMGYIASRLRGLEVVYEYLLNNIEKAWIAEGVPAIQVAPVSGKSGARVVVFWALCGAAFVLALAGAIVLLSG